MATWGYEFHLIVSRAAMYYFLFIHPGGERLRPEIPLRWHASGSLRSKRFCTV